MKYFVYLFLFVLAAPSAYSQRSSSIRLSSQRGGYELIARQIQIEQTNEFFGEAPNSLENIEGSAYLNEEFMPGSIYINGKLSQKNVLLRYNIHSDEIEIKNSLTNDDDYGAIIRDPEIYAKFDGRIFVFAPYRQSVEKGGYFVLTSSGEPYTLYKKYKSKFIPYKNAGAFGASESAKFIRSKKYYLVNTQGNFFDLPPTKSRLLRVLSDKKVELSEFIETNRLDVENQDHLIKIIAHYNNVLTQ